MRALRRVCAEEALRAGPQASLPPGGFCGPAWGAFAPLRAIVRGRFLSGWDCGSSLFAIPPDVDGKKRAWARVQEREKEHGKEHEKEGRLMLETSQVSAAKATIERVVGNVDSVIQGKHEVVELVVLALMARGHVLLEDLPGTGKTTLVSTLAKSIDCGFSRIQFTPDVMPSDVSGFSIFNQRTQDFEFRPGGVMSNLVLADEINRASAKTQSALLEAMEERQVTVDGVTRKLDEPFMVLATQNPIEQFGTYPLPEAQLDRFMAKLSMGYPDFDQEVRVLELGDNAKAAVRPVAGASEVLSVREAVKAVYASPMVLRYVVQIITATRDNAEVQVGSSPRGGIALLALARARALARDRGYVLPDDVKALAPCVLRHRVSLSHEAKVNGRSPDEVVSAILGGIHVPYIDENEARGVRA